MCSSLRVFVKHPRLEFIAELESSKYIPNGWYRFKEYSHHIGQPCDGEYTISIFQGNISDTILAFLGNWFVYYHFHPHPVLRKDIWIVQQAIFLEGPSSDVCCLSLNFSLNYISNNYLLSWNPSLSSLSWFSI